MARLCDADGRRFDVNDDVLGVRILDFVGVPFSLSAWVNHPSLLGAADAYFSGLNAASAFDGWEWGLGQTADKLGLYTDATVDGNWANFTHGPALGVWSHVCGVQTPTGRISYLDWDGISGKQTSTKNPVTDGATINKSIGGRHNDTDSAFAAIAEIAAWDRVLTDLEVQALASGKSPAFFPSGLVFYAKLDEPFGNPVDSGPHAMAITELGTIKPGFTAHPPISYPSTVAALSGMLSSSNGLNFLGQIP